LNSSYDLVEGDFIHETSLSTSNIQDDDINFLNNTMNSTYDLVEEDFIYQTPLSTSNIQDDDNIVDPSENDLVVNPHIDETPIMAEQGQISSVTCCKKVCRILPTPLCRNNLLRMRHERTCHVFKGFVGKCAVCGEKFTTSKLIWIPRTAVIHRKLSQPLSYRLIQVTSYQALNCHHDILIPSLHLLYYTSILTWKMSSAMH